MPPAHSFFKKRSILENLLLIWSNLFFSCSLKNNLVIFSVYIPYFFNITKKLFWIVWNVLWGEKSSFSSRFFSQIAPLSSLEEAVETEVFHSQPSARTEGNRTCSDCRGEQQGKSLLLTFKQTIQNSFLRDLFGLYLFSSVTCHRHTPSSKKDPSSKIFSSWLWQWFTLLVCTYVRNFFQRHKKVMRFTLKNQCFFYNILIIRV